MFNIFYEVLRVRGAAWTRFKPKSASAFYG